MVWCLRHVPSTGQNRTILSLTHGTMANAMPQALGAKAAFPDRQVISLSGDGGLTMLLGDLLTCIQEKALDQDLRREQQLTWFRRVGAKRSRSA